jgi:hypothetical protein
MKHTRATHIVVTGLVATLAMAVGIGAAFMSVGPASANGVSTAPVLSTGGGGGGTTNAPTPPSSSTPTSTATPPANTGTTGSQTVSHPAPQAPTGLKAKHTGPGVIALSWTLPNSSHVTAVIVQRAKGHCPTSTSDGARIGGTQKRHAQTDTKTSPGAQYCYTVFAENPYGVASAHTNTASSPPGKASNVKAAAVSNGVKVSWAKGAGATGYIVAAHAGQCPTTPNGFRHVPVHGKSLSTVDTNGQQGVKLCYSVFATNGTAYPAGAAHTHLISYPGTASSSPTTSAPAPTTSSSSAFSSSLVKVVGGVALAVLILAALAFGAMKLIGRERQDDWQYSSGRDSGRGFALGRYDGAALVIPAAIIVVGIALLVVAAVSL